jgi:hypothetical protein
MSIPQHSPPLFLSGLSDTVTLSWPATASDFVVESSSDLGSGIWTRETNAVIDVIGDQMIATVPLTSDQQFYRLHGPQVYVVPIFQFAVFYDKLMEFTWSAAFTANGRVHGNGDIYVGGPSALTFNSLVTAGGRDLQDELGWAYPCANDGANKLQRQPGLDHKCFASDFAGRNKRHSGGDA